MLKAGIYRSKTPTLTIEEHGGGKLKHHIFWYLCFYLPKRNVGLYGADSTDYVQPYLQNRIRLQGEIIELTDSRLSFFIFNHETGININFTGTIQNGTLHVTFYHDDKPNELYNDVLEYFWDGVSPL